MKYKNPISDVVIMLVVPVIVFSFIFLMLISKYVANTYDPSFLVFLGFVLGLLSGCFFGVVENRRFKKQVAEMIRRERSRVRMPISLHNLTPEDFRKMGGSDSVN